MKPKLKPTVTPSQLAAASSSSSGGGGPSASANSSMKMVRFAATPSLVEDDLHSLLQICNSSLAHHQQNGHWWAKSVQERSPTEEDIYGELMHSGLKINNQR